MKNPRKIKQEIVGLMLCASLRWEVPCALLRTTYRLWTNLMAK